MSDVLDALCDSYPDLRPLRPALDAAVAVLQHTFDHGGQVLVLGNGGSAADSEHIVGELAKGCTRKRPMAAAERQRFAALQDGAYLAEHLQKGLPARSLATHTALLTAIANDTAADLVFAQQVYALGGAHDLVWALSTSGNAQSVVLALETARAMGLATLGMTGSGGGRMAPYCDVLLAVPHTATQTVQERHLPIYHALCIAVEQARFPV